MIKKVSLGASELIELGRARCGRGEILVRGYTRRDGIQVASFCTRDMGAPGRTPASKRVLPKPVPGSMGVWKKTMPVAARHKELKKAVERRGCRQVIGSLTLLRNLTADTETSRTAKADAKWVHNQNFCKLKSKE